MLIIRILGNTIHLPIHSKEMKFFLPAPCRDTMKKLIFTIYFIINKKMSKFQSIQSVARIINLEYAW